MYIQFTLSENLVYLQSVPYPSEPCGSAAVHIDKGGYNISDGFKRTFKLCFATPYQI